ncbi:MAG TPA: arylamine N-acetyltransferase [Burkholderiaceae bacterium]|nr:arylamine N-acetyltransferase [Burkholderiaceae bacterium]
MSTDRIDLEAYLRRIAYDGPLKADRETLSRLIQHHAAAIAFENIDVLANRVPALDLPSLQRKLVHGRRGGYCFEHNGLFLACLRQIGFDARGLEGRVRAGVPTGTITGRTHMALQVSLHGEPYLADVGFGGFAPLAALAMGPARPEQRCPDGAVYRFAETDTGNLALQIQTSAGWDDCYHLVVVSTPQPIDYEIGNWYVATHPKAMLGHNLLVSRAVDGGRLTLFNHELTFRRAATDTLQQWTVRERDEFDEVLCDRFGLAVDAPDLDKVMGVLGRLQAPPERP